MLNLPGPMDPAGPQRRRLLLLAAGLIWIGSYACSCSGVSSSVQPTEMAGKRRLGQVVSEQPLGPGLHFKLPLLDQIDKLQVSLETYRIDHLTVNTIDNQPIAIAVGLTYRIPPRAVLKLLYEVGRVGNFDIADNFQRIIADRTAKVFAQQNTTTISENRERLSIALRTLLAADLGRLYGIEVSISRSLRSPIPRASAPRSRPPSRPRTKRSPRKTRSIGSASRRSRRSPAPTARPKPS